MQLENESNWNIYSDLKPLYTKSALKPLYTKPLWLSLGFWQVLSLII